MDASMQNKAENQPPFKVSIFARLIAAFCYLIPAVGGALSSFLLIGVFQGMREAENVGISTVMGAMKEAQIPVIASLYLAAVLGIAIIAVLVIRMFIQTKTASPPSWFFLIGGLLCLLPVAFFGEPRRS